MLRSVGRVIGVGGFGVGAGAASAAQQASCSACKSGSWNAAKVRASACVCHQGRGIATQQTVPSAPSWQLDDWEFTGGEGEFQPHHNDIDPVIQDRLIFGSVPTQEEVKEAVSDLHDALSQGIIPVSGTLSSSSSVHENSDSVEISTVQETENKSYGSLVYPNQMEQELHEEKYRIVHKDGHDNVREAFDMLQSNPAVQGMVISLASDKAMWDALLNNEKVIEFREALQKGESMRPELSKDTEKPPRHQENPFMQAFEITKMKVMECFEKITEVLQQFFGLADKKVLFEKDGDPVERTLKATLMLSVAVLLIVLVKRV